MDKVQKNNFTHFNASSSETFKLHTRCRENQKSHFKLPIYCPTGTSVCPGDSGGGIAFERDKKYYLRGVVSVGLEPEDGAKCFTDQYTAFTRVSEFLTWMEDNIR
jgi:secreted trypsin-like serine protease